MMNIKECPKYVEDCGYYQDNCYENCFIYLLKYIKICPEIRPYLDTQSKQCKC